MVKVLFILSYNTDEVQMEWTETGVSKMREKMELADYELVDIKNVRNVEVCFSAGSSIVFIFRYFAFICLLLFPIFQNIF